MHLSFLKEQGRKCKYNTKSKTEKCESPDFYSTHSSTIQTLLLSRQDYSLSLSLSVFITMFGLSLDQGAVLLLRRAVAPFIQMPCFYGKMYISPDDLTFIAASTPNPIFHNPSVVTALRLRPSFFDNFNCDESLCLVLDLYHLYDILCQARDDDYLGIYGNGTHNQVSIVLLGSGEY